MRLSIQNLSKSFGGTSLLSDFSLDLQSGVRLCVAGVNGAGKSTLLRLLAGVEAADSGKVVMPKECRMGYVEQNFDEALLSRALLSYVLDVLPDWNDFWQSWDKAAATHDESALKGLALRQADLERVYGYNPEQRAKSVLSGLGFPERTWGVPLRELSGGWRERAKLARILTAGADVLLLDEPTNHLDLEAVEWLESFLREYQGVLVFVAHDRVFMDTVSTHILYLGMGKPLFRKGGYTRFLCLQEEMEAQRELQASRIQEEIERKMAFVRRFRAKATKARQAGSRQKMAKKLEKELEGLAPPHKRKELEFSWPEPARSDRTVLSATDLAFCFPDGVKLWDRLSFSLYRGQKIALAGKNGCGKSTLLRLIVGRLEKTGGTVQLGQMVKVGYFSQHQAETLNAVNTVLAEIRRLADPRTTEEELMSVLGLFLLGQSYFDRSVGSLSGGEKCRLILASLFLARCNFLILDEPTNHLDIESREALVEALDDFSGTVLMVAHDRFLLSSVTEEVWHLDGGSFVRYERGYEQYAEARRASTDCGSNMFSATTEQRTTVSVPPLSREEQKRVKRDAAAARNAAYKEMKPLQEAYAALEKELEGALALQAAAESSLADPEICADGARSTALLKECHMLRNKAESVMEQMEELEGRIAGLERRRAH